MARVMKYADSTIGETVQRHELDGLKASWVVAKRELAEQLDNITPKIKFELFASEGSQAKDLKDYMATVEASLTRNQEKIGWLEEAVHLERERGLNIDKAVEKAIEKTRESLKSLVLEGELDISVLRKDLVVASHQYAEMQRMMLHGEMMTAPQVEALVTGLLGSESFDQVLSNRIHSKAGPLSDYLSSLASKHEVEALRKILVDQRGDPQGTTGSGSGSGSGEVASSQGSSDSSIVTLFKRAAVLEEAVVRTEEQGRALEVKLNAVIANGGLVSSTAGVNPSSQVNNSQLKFITSRLESIEGEIDRLSASSVTAPQSPSPSPQGGSFRGSRPKFSGKFEDGATDLGSVEGSRRFPTHPALAAQISLEGVNTEIAGLVYDMAHLSHEELIVTKDGPLPGSSGQGPTAASIREAALQRLRGKPIECQRHVELLEKAKGTLNRFFSSTAHSTMDWLSLSTLMMDIRLKLLEDYTDIQRDQIAKVYVNLEQAFDYLRKLQDAVNSKATTNAVHGLEKVLGAMAHECLLLGPSSELNGRDGALSGSRLSTTEFWSSLLSGRGGHQPSSSSIQHQPPSSETSSSNLPPKASHQGPLLPSSPSGGYPRTSPTQPGQMTTRAGQGARAASARSSPMGLASGRKSDREIPAIVMPTGNLASSLFISPRELSSRFSSSPKGL